MNISSLKSSYGFRLGTALILGSTAAAIGVGALCVFENSFAKLVEARSNVAKWETAWPENDADKENGVSPGQMNVSDTEAIASSAIKADTSLRRWMSTDQLLSRVHEICPASLPLHSLGRLAVAFAILDVDVALALGGQQATDDESLALVFARMDAMFEETAPMHEQVFDAIVDAREWGKVIDQQYSGYSQWFDILDAWNTSGELRLRSSAALRQASVDPAEVGLAFDPNQVLAELNRMRVDGYTTANLWHVPSSARTVAWQSKKKADAAQFRRTIHSLAVATHLGLNPDKIPDVIRSGQLPNLSGATINEVLGSGISHPAGPANRSASTRTGGTSLPRENAGPKAAADRPGQSYRVVLQFRYRNGQPMANQFFRWNRTFGIEHSTPTRSRTDGDGKAVLHLEIPPPYRFYITLELPQSKNVIADTGEIRGPGPHLLVVPD